MLQRMDKSLYKDGLRLLSQPALPLLSIIHFIYVTGEFDTVDEVISELPEPIETEYTVYEQPKALLQQFLPQLKNLEQLKITKNSIPSIIDTEGQILDPATALLTVVMQDVLEKELEAINSALCAPCGCVRCCTGPEDELEQEFFEIPLQDIETKYFSAIEQIDTATSRAGRAMDDKPLLIDGQPFFKRSAPVLICWQNGWSLILPKKSSCPNLDEAGRCRIYPNRPSVCRKPQLFAYILEDIKNNNQSKRLRSTLLGITDCPYVRDLKETIAAYAGACELDFLLTRNKQ